MVFFTTLQSYNPTIDVSHLHEDTGKLQKTFADTDDHLTSTRQHRNI